eukprot:TRINITY_DN5266_c0_g1_i11.p2 TRINITY_DN5266_c0_g1~~TRINITY_DN5266_c0_g1_i11.p2  ORF type:complete len:112 (-),score=7.53 TRINITY_DN5266_c0_g1_i11:154-462(-)
MGGHCCRGSGHLLILDDVHNLHSSTELRLVLVQWHVRVWQPDRKLRWLHNPVLVLDPEHVPRYPKPGTDSSSVGQLRRDLLLQLHAARQLWLVLLQQPMRAG